MRQAQANRMTLIRTMKRILLAVALVVLPLGAQQQSAFDFSIRNIMRGPELYGRPPENVLKVL